MRYICNICGNVVEEHDITIHHDNGSNGFEINAICQQCLEKYMEIRKGDTNRKEDENERMRMKRKW
jgi:hypothetical protein